MVEGNDEKDNLQKNRIKKLLIVAETVLKINNERCFKAFIFYFIALIVIGLPIWYITTSPYRASLENFNDIKNIVNESLLDQTSEKFPESLPGIWNDISLSAAYNLHLIFVHENGNNDQWDLIEKSIVLEVNKMVNYLSDTVFFTVTTEHLWDLFHSDIFKKKENNKLYFKDGGITKFITTIDRYSSPMISTDPLLKLVFVLTDDGIVMDELQSNGQTFASWGSIINVSFGKVDIPFNAIYESFHSLFGAQHSFNQFSSPIKHPDHYVWNNFRNRVFIENIRKTKHFVTAINTLTSKIDQLVITEEVSELVRKSKMFVQEAITEKNPLKASLARLLAERAADHSSLIGTGDLTSSLKIGIYVPIGMPLLLPIVEVMLRYLWGKFKNGHVKID